MEKGIRGIQQDIYAQLDKLPDASRQDADKMTLYRSMLIALDGVLELARRYSELALQAARQEEDPARRRELIEISRICHKVPFEPPETLHEALQCFYIVFIAFHSTLEYVPLGRSDQYFYPFYKNDLASGRLTQSQAEELVGSWLAKFSERVQMNPDHWEALITAEEQQDGGDPNDMAGSLAIENDDDYNYGTSANHWLMNMILGGQDAQGNDATNDLTYTMLKMWDYLEPVAPVLSVRVHKGAPNKLYRMCASILRRGAGEPAIYNNDMFIKGMVDMGIPLEETRCYSNDGCWEVLIPGCTYYSYFCIELLQMLEYVLNRGESLIRHKKEGLDSGDASEMDSFEALYSALTRQIEHQTKRILHNKIDYYKERVNIAPSPLLSSMMDDCIEKGLDLSVDGTRYNMYGLMLTGTLESAGRMSTVLRVSILLPNCP